MLSFQRTFSARLSLASGIAMVCLLTSPLTQAKVSPEEAEKLGTTLTPTGANPLGNAEGTIPAWTGKIVGVPSWITYKGTGTHYPPLYPDEKPLFTITAANYQQHIKHLTDGQVALFKRYPDTFRMPIYASKRDANYSEWVRANIKQNAISASLKSNGNGTTDVFGGTPFPIPQSAVEMVWNHQASPMFGASRGISDGGAVFTDGTIVMRQMIEERMVYYYAPEVGREKFNQMDIGGKIMVQLTEPAKDRGQIVLIHEYKDQTGTSRDAWAYLPGTRRVRRAPTISYDFPDGPGGLRTVDDALLFNGALDRYNWSNEPDRELYVPYNDNALDDPKVKYTTLLTPHHINPDYMRYELHRCHVVVAKLREDKRHIYTTRRLYLDEDTWAALLADNYDGHGELWRTGMRSFIYAYDLPGMTARVEMYHDLQKQAYLTNYLVNELPGPPAKVDPALWGDDYFTVNNVRAMGK